MSEGPPRSSGRYSAIAIVLHWTIAAAVLIQLGLATRLEADAPETFAVIQLHKSVGVTILALSLIRLAWRLSHRPAPMPEGVRGWERRLAAFTHAAFYVVIIGMPLTGWIMVSTAKLEIPTLLYGVAPFPHAPVLSGLEGEARGLWNTIGYAGHLALAWGLILLLPLHVAGALKHQLFGEAPILARMAPGARPGRWAEPRLVLVLAGAAAAFLLGLKVTPPPPGVSPPLQGEQPLTKVDAVPVAGGSGWAVEDGSTIYFHSSWGGTPVRGHFRRWKAEIAFDPENVAGARARIEVDLSSLTSGEAQRDGMIASDAWLAVLQHPTAVFETNSFDRLAPDAFVAHGTLTLRGIEKPAQVMFRPVVEGDRVRIGGVASLDRTNFSIGPAASEGVPPKVAVSIDLRARRMAS